jgi:hypothetical protein
MDVTQPYVFSFNSFTGDGAPIGLDRIDPSSNILIFNQTTGVEVYDTGALPDTTTSYVLPANTLQPGDIYTYILLFRNGEHLPGSPGYFINNINLTSGTFTTAIGPGGPQVLADFQGGEPGSPVGLPIVGQIGDVTGSIGGVGSTEFYKMFWSGGDFSATMSLTGANADASYLFELLDSLGNVIDSFTLNSKFLFSGTLRDNIGAGFYEIGLVANDSRDPYYDLEFNTPVEGVVPQTAAVPEPSIWSMLIIGFMAIGFAMRRARKLRTIHLVAELNPLAP